MGANLGELDDLPITSAVSQGDGPPIGTPLVIQSAIQSANLFTFTWNTTENQLYQVQYTTNLAENAWFNLGYPIVATNSTTTASDLMSSQQVFYRVSLVAP